MPDTAPVHTVPVTDATERAVRAALRISARNGCALTRDAAEQIAKAILGCAAAAETITREELTEALEHELDGCFVGSRELAVNVFAYIRARPLPRPRD